MRLPSTFRSIILSTSALVLTAACGSSGSETQPKDADEALSGSGGAGSSASGGSQADPAGGSTVGATGGAGSAIDPPAMGGDSNLGGQGGALGTGGNEPVDPLVSLEAPGVNCTEGGLRIDDGEVVYLCHGDDGLACVVTPEQGTQFNVVCGEHELTTSDGSELPGVNYLGTLLEHPEGAVEGDLFTLQDQDVVCSLGALGWQVFGAGQSTSPGEDCLPVPQYVVLVDAGAPALGNGERWLSAFRNLQDALACVRVGSSEHCAGAKEIWVAGGLYYPDDSEYGNAVADSRSESFKLVNSTGLYGGFLPYERKRTGAAPKQNVTVLRRPILITFPTMIEE